MKRVGIAAAAISLLLFACSSSSEAPEPQGTGAPAEEETKRSGEFDRLTMTLELNASEVPAGRAVGSHITVRNDSGRAVRDPGCVLAAFRFALVPVDDPDAELWGQVITDCAGAFVIKPGYVDRYSGPTFQATDKFGDPLPPGEYIATVTLDLRSEPLTQPVTVTD